MIHDEVLETVYGEHLLDSGPDAMLPPAVPPGRGRPLVARAIGALGQPDAPGRHAEVAPVGLDGRPELEVDRLLAGEERQVTVGRRARKQLEVAAALEVREGAEEVAVEASVQLPHLLVKLLPEGRERYDRPVSLPLELGPAVGARAAEVVSVELELALVLGRGELLGEDGRDADRPLRGDAVGHQAPDGPEQRQVAFEGGLAEPVAPVRPPPVVDHHRQVRVQDQRERVTRHRDLGHIRREG